MPVKYTLPNKKLYPFDVNLFISFFIYFPKIKSILYIIFSCEIFCCFFHSLIKVFLCQFIKLRNSNIFIKGRYFVFNYFNFCIIICFLTKSVVLGIFYQHYLLFSPNWIYHYHIIFFENWSRLTWNFIF